MLAIAILGTALAGLSACDHQSMPVGNPRANFTPGFDARASRVDRRPSWSAFPSWEKRSGDFQASFPGKFQDFRWERVVEASGTFPDVREVKVPGSLWPDSGQLLRAGRAFALAGTAGPEHGRDTMTRRSIDARAERLSAGPIDQRGFTLIEMMLAVGVLGIILAMLASSFSAVAHSKVHAEGRLLVDREGRALLWQMSKEVRNAVQTPQPLQSHVLLLGAAHSGNNGPIDTFMLSTFDAGHRRAITGLAPEYIVTYNVISNPDHPGWYVLQRSQQSGLMPSGAPAQTQVLANNLLSLHLRYFDGQRWTEEWNSSAATMERSCRWPWLSRFEMAAPGGRVMDFATQVTVPMAMAQW